MNNHIKIELKNVFKKFKDKIVLDNINYSFESGRIYGLCGINGSGKTMLLRVIAGLVKPSSGEVSINSIDDSPISIGITLNKVGFFEELSAFENLRLLASLRNKISDHEIRESLIKIGLDPNNGMGVAKYSLGMRQRLSLAQAIMEEPQILLLDEPTNALDEDGVELIHKIIKEEKEKGKIIILTSHNKYDIESLSDTILKISDGKVREYEV